MATTEEFRLQDAGSIIRLICKKGNVVFPVDTATTLKIIILKKDDTLLIVDAEFPIGGNGSDGVVQYQFQPGDLSIEGEWQAQAFARFSDTENYFSTIVKFKVGKNLATLLQVEGE